MIKQILFGLIILTLPLMYGCKEKVVKYEDSGATVHLKVGQLLNVELEGNASTGNSWRKITYDDQIILKDGEPGFVASGDRIGSGGVYDYKFKAVTSGITRLYMEYGSKYDANKEPVKTFELEVVVGGK